MGTLDGRRALVTGAGMGIGQGCALALAGAGAAVAVHYASSATGARDTVGQIEATGGRAIVIGGDLGQVIEARRVVAEAAAVLGGLDILINNAGVTRALDFADTTEVIFDEVFDINIKGMFFATQAALPHFEAAGRGAVVNLTSVHGFAGFPRHAAYAATKGAIIAFTRELAVELAPKRVRVNAIGPGLIEVPRYFDIPGYTTAMGDAMVPWGRVGTPADCGAAAVFLVSDAADFVTGQVLYVDGGTTARMGLWWDQGNRPQ
ncbi:MAG: glucose 1-dehydrogenase [Chloroflexi bacterium]|nr:glucose 1-dehydrogenase [Chloroflexota bacterium]